MSMTAFDLEQDILKCWNVTTDIGEILDDLESGHMEFHDAVQALRAYQQVYERRFDRCFRRFEQFNQEVWALRHPDLPVVQVEDLDWTLPKKGKKGRSKGKKAVDQ